MQPRALATNTRKPIMGDEAQEAIKKGVDLAYEVAKAAYGPSSGNVAIEAQYGDPIISHDGVFNLDHLHTTDAGIDMACRILVQASRSTNTHVGDGTTAAAIVAASVYREARAVLANTKDSRFKIARRIHAAAVRAVEEADKLKIKATPELLHDVAVISASDEAIGSLISDTIQEVGADGGVIVEDFGGAGIYNDIVDGFYFRKGFTNAATLTDPSNLESRFDKVFVLVCEKELSSVGDIAPILDKCIDANIRDLVLVGTVTTEALAVVVKLNLERIQSSGTSGITCTVVDAPDWGEMRHLFMDDLALYVGGKILSGGANARDFTVDMLGAAKVVVNEFSSTFIDGERNEEQGKALKHRTKELSKELKVATSPIEQEAVRTRLGRLTGKIAILRVGGNTDVERQEVKLRVEDSVAALQSAIKDGVVPGGGVTLARLPDDLDFKAAFEQPFLALMENAGWNAPGSLDRVKAAKPWEGYDLRDDEVHQVSDLKKAGVVDPTMVIKEVINNGCSVAAELIKTLVLLPFDNREAKRG